MSGLLDLITGATETLEDEMDCVSFYDLEEFLLDEWDIELKVVHTRFTDAGRWSNSVTRVVECRSEFFQIEELVPATEMQEGQDGDGITEIFQVRPVEVTRTEYVKV